ncbi:MAG: indole-3-glycerol phosphate synthase TrpC [Bacteroidota bacterium]|nr:indole-3-glycerol phosphate synthase TrpC [Bacteroidota bacterium]
MTILDKIIAHKHLEVAALKKIKRAAELEKESLFSREPLSLRDYLLKKEKTGIIAEFKRKSPSKGVINSRSTVGEVTSAYARNGASAISVLTDREFFGGSILDMKEAAMLKVPILRKDFMIDPYQVVEAKAYGASVILLIAACLSKAEVKKLAGTAKGLGLSVLLEIHHEGELDHICDPVDVVGVNNRDLKTFTVDIQRSESLSHLIPSDKLKISESGISDPRTIQRMKKWGYDGFLMGERFMKQADPGQAFRKFAEKLKSGV